MSSRRKLLHVFVNMNHCNTAGAYSETTEKKLAPSSILREAKVAYYARNMFEAGRFVLFFVKAT